MSPEEELRFLILGAQREGNRIFAGLLAPLGVTPSQAEALRVLQDAGSLSLIALGSRLVCESGSPSRLVSTLVDKQWVARTEDPKDRRLVTLRLTRSGGQLARQVRKVEDRLHGWIAARLSSDDIAAVSGGLRALLADSAAEQAVAARIAAGLQEA
jgi:MarR family transcriptional regulator, organic hydroperoxide resistance regulator